MYFIVCCVCCFRCVRRRGSCCSARVSAVELFTCPASLWPRPLKGSLSVLSANQVRLLICSVKIIQLCGPKVCVNNIYYAVERHLIYYYCLYYFIYRDIKVGR